MYSWPRETTGTTSPFYQQEQHHSQSMYKGITADTVLVQEVCASFGGLDVSGEPSITNDTSDCLTLIAKRCSVASAAKPPKPIP